MKTRPIVIAAVVMLALFLTGALYAQTADARNPARPAPAPTPAQMAAEDYNRWVQVYHDRAVAYALALYDYARTSEGFLEKAVVQRCVDEIDGAIAEADQSLSRIEGQIEVPDSGQQMEITDIRTDYGIANDHVAKLKLALEAPPIDRNRVETEARAISDVMLKAAREVERLRVFKAVRKPPDFPLAEVR